MTKKRVEEKFRVHESEKRCERDRQRAIKGECVWKGEMARKK